MEEKLLFEVIVGTYEQFVLGYKLIESEHGEKFVVSFANHSHQGTVKSVSTSGKWLASSSSDETIRLYDMVHRKESGLLMEQNGTISCVSFTPDTSYLISASEDGSIAMFKTGSWIMEKLWKSAHKGSSVAHVAVHPTGKMALSIGKDQTLRTWNLVKGRPAYTTNLSRCRTQLELVVWSTEGNFYAIPMYTTLELFSVSTAGVSHVYKFLSKVTAVVFFSDKVLCVGEDNGEFSGQCTETGLELWRLKSGEKRIRGIAVYKKYLVISCSSGIISAYKMSSWVEAPVFVATINSGCRITCVSVHNIEDIGTIKQEKKVKTDKKVNENEKVNKVRSRSNQFTIENCSNGDLKPKEVTPIKCVPRKQSWDIASSAKKKKIK